METLRNEPTKKYFTLDTLQAAEREKLNQPSESSKEWFPIPQAGEVNLESRIHVENIHITEAYIKELHKYLDKALVDFTGFNSSRCKGFVQGLSGGIDSATIAKIAQDYCRERGVELKTLIMGTGPKELGHSERWIRDIKEKRIDGEECRRSYGQFSINEYAVPLPERSPNLMIDRSLYFPQAS